MYYKPYSCNLYLNLVTFFARSELTLLLKDDKCVRRVLIFHSPTPGIIKTSKNITVKELLIKVSSPVVTPSATG